MLPLYKFQEELRVIQKLEELKNLLTKTLKLQLGIQPSSRRSIVGKFSYSETPGQDTSCPEKIKMNNNLINGVSEDLE